MRHPGKERRRACQSAEWLSRLRCPLRESIGWPHVVAARSRPGRQLAGGQQTRARSVRVRPDSRAATRKDSPTGRGPVRRLLILKENENVSSCLPDRRKLGLREEESCGRKSAVHKAAEIIQ